MNMKSERENIIQEVFAKEIEGLSQCAEFLKRTSLEPLNDILGACSGRMFFSGVGKNEYVVKKIVHTMQSLSLPAFYLDALGGLHGDLGVLDKGDVLCLFSKSGNTKELCVLNDEAKKRQVKTVVVTCGKTSLLAKSCDYLQLLPDVREADEMNILPTVSTTMFLCFGDALALELSETRKSINSFSDNHPGGELGKLFRGQVCLEKRKRIRMLIMDVDGTLTDGTLQYEKGDVVVRYHSKDGYGIRHLLPKFGIESVIITGRTNGSVIRRAETLQISKVYQNVTDKETCLKQVSRETGISLEEMAYIGDDLNDLSCLRMCGLTGCPADAVEAVKTKCDFISQYNGGAGAVREFIDWICMGREQ